MKKILNKSAASVMAVTMLLSGAICTTASAQEATANDISQINSLYSDSDPIYFVPYDSYDI